MNEYLKEAPENIPAELGEPPILLWIKTELLNVDKSYQRTTISSTSQRLISNISKGFKWEHFGAIAVSKRPDGTYYIRDGQHRLIAAKKIKLPYIPCIIHMTETVEKEASSFIKINKERNSMSALSIHHAGVIAGDPIHIKISKICENAGVRIAKVSYSATFLPWGITQSVAVLKKFHKILDGKPLESALIAINEAAIIDGEKATGYLSASMIHGVAMIYEDNYKNDLFDPDRLIEIIQSRPPDQWQSNARAYAIATDVSTPLAMKTIIIKGYNKNKPQSSRI